MVRSCCACLQISVGLHRFTYDNVYGSGGGDSAVNLYPDCVQPLVDGLFKGYNATVFAYGELIAAQIRQVHKAAAAHWPSPTSLHTHTLHPAAEATDTHSRWHDLSTLHPVMVAACRPDGVRQDLHHGLCLVP